MNPAAAENTLHSPSSTADDTHDRPEIAGRIVPDAHDLSQPPVERRQFRRHELAETLVVVERFDPVTQTGTAIGEIVDLSAGGVRIRTGDPTIRPGQMLSIRLRLPSHAGITPFVRLGGEELAPACEWVGTLSALRRIERPDGSFDIGGRLLGMDEVTRGMLGLYLSIQPLAA